MITLKRRAKAVWQGGLKAGGGRITTDSRALEETPYSFATRFESGKGSNPEELVAAAHAACFSMALSSLLEKSGATGSTRVETQETATLEKVGAGWEVTELHLEVSAEAPGISREQFENLANEAKQTCPISKLMNARITLSTRLAEKAA